MWGWPPIPTPTPVGVPRTPFRPDPVLVGCVALGGALGGTARYAVAQALPRVGTEFPWATLVVNLVGAAVLGFVLVALADRPPPADRWRAFLGTGVCGGFTTFSTLSVEAVLLTRRRRHHGGRLRRDLRGGRVGRGGRRHVVGAAAGGCSVTDPGLFLGVAAAGAVGASARFLVDGFVRSRTRDDLPYGTLLINLSGSFLLGLLTGLALTRGFPRRRSSCSAPGSAAPTRPSPPSPSRRSGWPKRTSAGAPWSTSGSASSSAWRLRPPASPWHRWASAADPRLALARA